MKLLYLMFILLAGTDDVPFKAREEFEVNLNFEFKTRMTDNSVVYPNTRSTGNSSGPLPYLKMDLRIIKLIPDEVRLRVVDGKNNVIITKKVAMGDVVKLDLGYTDDIKDGVTSHEYIFYFLTQDKKPLSRVYVHFLRDGTFFINEEKRGKV